MQDDALAHCRLNPEDPVAHRTARTLRLLPPSGPLWIVAGLLLAGSSLQTKVSAAQILAAAPVIQRKAEYVDDATITAGVRKAILSDGAINAAEIQVDTLKGVVQLTGYVKTSDQSAAAAKDAASVRGVEAVRNNLIVRSAPPPL